MEDSSPEWRFWWKWIAFDGFSLGENFNGVFRATLFLLVHPSPFALAKKAEHRIYQSNLLVFCFYPTPPRRNETKSSFLWANIKSPKRDSFSDYLHFGSPKSEWEYLYVGLLLWWCASRWSFIIPRPSIHPPISFLPLSIPISAYKKLLCGRLYCPLNFLLFFFFLSIFAGRIVILRVNESLRSHPFMTLLNGSSKV